MNGPFLEFAPPSLWCNFGESLLGLLFKSCSCHLSFHCGLFCFVSFILLFVQFPTPMFQSFGSPCCFATASGAGFKEDLLIKVRDREWFRSRFTIPLSELTHTHTHIILYIHILLHCRCQLILSAGELLGSLQFSSGQSGVGNFAAGIFVGSPSYQDPWKNNPSTNQRNHGSAPWTGTAVWFLGLGSYGPGLVFHVPMPQHVMVDWRSTCKVLRM